MLNWRVDNDKGQLRLYLRVGIIINIKTSSRPTKITKTNTKNIHMRALKYNLRKH